MKWKKKYQHKREQGEIWEIISNKIQNRIEEELEGEDGFEGLGRVFA